MAVLEEIGARYEKVLVDINNGEHRIAEYLIIHPLGLVPAFRLMSSGPCACTRRREPLIQSLLM